MPNMAQPLRPQDLLRRVSRSAMTFVHDIPRLVAAGGLVIKLS